MYIQRLSLAIFSLSQFIQFFNQAKNLAPQLRRVDKKNSQHTLTAEFINTSPNSTWLLRDTGDDINYMLINFYLVLLSGESQFFEFTRPLEYFVYEVCDTTGPASVLYVNGSPHKCAVGSGAMINITATANNMEVRAIENTAIESVSINGNASPYSISAIPIAPPNCDIPYPMQYLDGKQRIINLEGATLYQPKFPNICDLIYFAEAGVNTIRLPFKWDYLQCFVSSDIPIDWSEGGYGAQMVKVTNAWTAKNYSVILSMYDHMHYSYCSIGASDCWVDQTRYANAWGQIATQFIHNPRVIFGLMNEPEVYDFVEGYNNGTAIVLNNQNAAAQAIRAVGAEQLILYSGNGRSKIENWHSNEYGESNDHAFIPKNISDHHYGIDVQMFYEAPETLIEEGCIASAENDPKTCIDKQHPENFSAWMHETGIQVIVGQTGGTHSSDCIVCINYGTSWMMMQNNITGIGMWTGGHAWLDFNGSTNYPLYLAPIHHMPQNQMTQGFQNVSNQKTGERFLINLSERIPSAAPTQTPANSSSTEDYLSIAWLSAYAVSGVAVLGILYLLSRYQIKKACIFLGRNRHGVFSSQPALLATDRSPSYSENSKESVMHSV